MHLVGFNVFNRKKAAYEANQIQAIMSTKKGTGKRMVKSFLNKFDVLQESEMDMLAQYEEEDFRL